LAKPGAPAETAGPLAKAEAQFPPDRRRIEAQSTASAWMKLGPGFRRESGFK
jgi:hypothetical protein